MFLAPALTHKPYQEIKEMTIYQFNKELERLNLIKNFEVYTYPMLKGGNSEGIMHWLSHIPERGRYDNVLIDRSDFNKIANSIEN